MICFRSARAGASLLGVAASLAAPHVSADDRNNLPPANGQEQALPSATPASSGWHPDSNINRLQARYLLNDAISLSQSSYARWGAWFALADLEHTDRYETSPRYTRLETIVGAAPSGQPFGAAARFQGLTGQPAVWSLGMQFSLTELSFLKDAARRHNVNVFAQLFPLRSDHNVDLLLYYQLPLPGKLALRGNTNWMSTPGGRNYWRVFADVIYPVNRKFDVYLRFLNQNRSDIQYGITGTTWSLGARWNFVY